MRILWLKTELLHPVDKGGKIRTFHMLKELKREHHITYLTLDDGSGAKDAGTRADEYCHELITVPHRTRPKFSAGFYLELGAGLASSVPYFVKKYESGHMRREIERLSGKARFDVLVCDFLAPSINVPSSMGEPTVLFQHNVEATIWKRHHEVQSNPIKKWYLYSQWRKSVAYECRECRRFNRVIAVSPEDVTTMKRDYGIERIDSVPTGVDTEFYRPGRNVEGNSFSLVFTGSMDWLPNQDAVQWFTRDILPLVRKAIPQVTLTVVGRNPYPSLIEESRRDPSIIVTGRVEDVRPYVERAALYVVPIRIGGGTRLKIFEAMAMEKAVVSTRIGAEGLPVRHGVDVILADSAGEFAEAVLRMLGNQAGAREMGLTAAGMVRREFGWRAASDAFAVACQETIEGRQAKP
jgi:glycosyltransferase involved in cell wall biosynthesis